MSKSFAPNGVLFFIEWNEKAIQHEKVKYCYELDYIDPKEYLSKGAISNETILGEFNNIYNLRKNY